MDKASNDFAASPSPGGSSSLNSPAHLSIATGSGLDSFDMSHTPGRTMATSEIARTWGEEPRISPNRTLSSRDAMPGGDTEASVARDTFEGMLETLSRTKESIARATRHALDCAKFGIADQVSYIFSICACPWSFELFAHI